MSLQLDSIPNLCASDALEIRAILTEDPLTDVDLFIATPCFGGQVAEGYFRSMLTLTKVLDAASIKHTVYTIANESLVTRARNSSVAEFLGNTNRTHLLFIDADISFSPLAVLRLIAQRKQVVGGCYPSKGINWSRFRELASSDQLTDEDVLASSLPYVVNLHFQEDSSGQKQVMVENDFIRVRYIGTGFLLLARSVFDVMTQNYPELLYINDIPGYNTPASTDNFWLFFDTMQDPSTKRYLSEDYAFCQRWLDTGGEIWMDMISKFTHIGSFRFPGDVCKIFEQSLSSQ